MTKNIIRTLCAPILKILDAQYKKRNQQLMMSHALKLRSQYQPIK